MFKKVKKILGIEGAKVELSIPSHVGADEHIISGHIMLHTIDATTIHALTIELVEVYTRGRRKNKRTDDYVLGSLVLDNSLQLTKDEKLYIPFELPFDRNPSAMDEFENKNIFTAGIAKIAKYVKGTKSSYYVQVTLDEEGTRLSPKDKQEIEIY